MRISCFVFRNLFSRLTKHATRNTDHGTRSIHVNTLCNTNPSTVRITHAAHPLRGCCVLIRQVLEREGESYLLIERPDGRTQCIPQSWTDQAPPIGAAPGACFTPSQLQALSRWRDAHLDKLAAGGVSPAVSHSGGTGDEYSRHPAAPDGAMAHPVPGSPPTPTGPVESLGVTPLDNSTHTIRGEP